ncbi:FtsX-like permease family protein [Protaetiibacter sp. SSC-01]|uniref:FtsX-like permease family protein n=1 Tax=Protaetiibacter sp. SSC-01 TaxID=2759943 RepID=UPI001657298F|nr:FtsX-like permease family protein [Protaetiibacter sp. SSC-01]QNO38296.1 FtsX-like permease family protein [Protaetiibacter sp. SSC-01]
MSRRPSRARIAAAILAEAPGASLVVLLLAALLGGSAAAASAWASDARSDVLHSALDASPPSQRDLGDSVRGLPVSAPGTADHGLSPELARTWGATFDALDQLTVGAEPAAADVLGRPHAALRLDQAPAEPVDGAPSPDSRVILSADPLIDELADVVEGERPGRIERGEPIQIAVTQAISDALGWPLGQVRAAHYSTGDVELVLVGILAPKDADAPEWDHAAVALAPEVIDNFLAPPTFVGMGYLDPASIGDLTEHAATARLEVWLPVDVAVIDADTAGETVAAIRRLGSTPHTTPIVMPYADVEAPIALSGTTPSIILATQPLLAGVTALHSAIVSGVALAGAAVVALAVRALVARRRSLLRLLAARGASDGARAGALAAGVGALTALGAGIAGGIVLAVMGGPAATVAIVVVGLVALAAAAAAIDGALFERAGVRPDESARRRTSARIAVDAGVVLLAVAAAVLVVATPASAGSAPPPLAVVLPALLAAAGCMIALRLVPLLVRVLEGLARGTRGLVSLLGPARAGRDATTGIVPVLALLTAVTVAVLGSGLLSTVQHGVEEAARAQVGADVRVDARYLSDELIAQAEGLDGVEALATVASDSDIEIEFPDGDGRITVYVVDPVTFAAASTSTLEIPDAGAIVSETVARRLAGEPLQVGRDEVPVAGTAPDDGPFGRATAWIAVSAETGAELDLKVRPKALLIATDAAAADDVRATLAARVAGYGTARTVDEVLAERRDAPAVRALIVGTALAVIGAAVLTVLAAVLALTSGAPARARVFGLLRALGARPRAEYALVLWELLPALAVAVPLGLAAGLGLVPLVARAGDLTVFTRGGAQPAIDLGLGTSLGIVAALVAVVVLGVLLAAAIARRSGASRAVRTVDEEG